MKIQVRTQNPVIVKPHDDFTVLHVELGKGCEVVEDHGARCIRIPVKPDEFKIYKEGVVQETLRNLTARS